MVHGEARVVFALEESGSGEWGKYMDEYWAEEEEQGGKCDGVAWLRDLGQARWSAAGTRLLKEAKGAGDVGIKHVSIFSCCLFALRVGVDQWVLVYA
jgi:nuclear pore complex protein Nup133